jgi:hypothetical protein
MSLSDCLLDHLHLINSMFSTILLNKHLLLFSDCSCQVLHILDLLLLFNFELILFLFQKILVEVHYSIVVNLILLLHVTNLYSSNLLDASSIKISQDFLGSLLSHEVELIQKHILLPFLFFLDLLFSKVSFLFNLLLHEEVLKVLRLI